MEDAAEAGRATAMWEELSSPVDELPPAVCQAGTDRSRRGRSHSSPPSSPRQQVLHPPFFSSYLVSQIRSVSLSFHSVACFLFLLMVSYENLASSLFRVCVLSCSLGLADGL